MARGSTYIGHGILNVLRGTVFPLAETGSVYVGLRDGGVEVTEGGYARAAVSKAAGSWDAPAAGVTQNTGAISFGPATADWAAGLPIDEVAIYDAAAAGNLLYTATLAVAKTILDGDSAEFAAGALSVTET
jgi:hypothetical protein